MLVYYSISADRVSPQCFDTVGWLGDGEGIQSVTFPAPAIPKRSFGDLRGPSLTFSDLRKDNPVKQPRAGCSRAVRIDPLRFLAGCRTSPLNQALSVSSLLV